MKVTWQVLEGMTLESVTELLEPGWTASNTTTARPQSLLDGSVAGKGMSSGSPRSSAAS